jgi:hypothetical protein
MNQMAKPQFPDMQGPQYADSPTGGIVSRDSNYLKVNYDQSWNEIAEDRVMHGNATAMEGAWSYDEGHYAGDFKSYGVEVMPPSGVERMAVDVSRADRGKES